MTTLAPGQAEDASLLERRRMAQRDDTFTGAVPEIYQRHLGGWLFTPYAADLAERARRAGARRTLEIAAGTGIVTAFLQQTLPEASIYATDLNAAMVDFARATVRGANIRWLIADANALPFAEGQFDLVVCQFGVMFLDRSRALAEVRRVLSRGGTFLFNVWARIEDNAAARIVSDACKAVFPSDPPAFLERTPYGHGDPVAIEGDLRAAGFHDIETVAVSKRGVSTAESIAIGLCEGTPLRFEILARDPQGLSKAVRQATGALRAAFHGDAVDGAMKAYVFSAR